MRVVTYSEARQSLKTLLDGVVDDADIAIIHRRDAENAVLMSESHYSSLVETLYLQSGANGQVLAESIAQLRAGRARARVLAAD
jgi:antitoxin YefM